jgi:uncharacterized protein (TIRG00374 family)
MAGRLAYHATVGTRTRTMLFLVLRLLGFGLAVWVLSTQVRIDDELVLTDGTQLSGRVTARPDGGFDVVLADGSIRPVEKAEIAERREGVPHVTYGFASLARRVGESPFVGLAVLLTMAGILVLMAWRWQRLLAAVGLIVRFAETVRLTFIGGFFSLVVPGSTGGDVVKAYYAARRTGRNTRAVLSVFVDRVIGVFTLVIVAAVALFLGPGGEGYQVARVTVLAFLLGGTLAFVVFASRTVRRGLGLSALVRKLPFQRVIEEIKASAELYRGRPGTIVVAFLVSIVNQLGLATVVWALAQALHIEGVSLIACYALVPITNLLSAVPIVPGGWGVGELAYAYFFGQIGVPATEAVGLSVVYRLSFLLVNVPGGVFWLLMRDHASRDEVEGVVERATEQVGELATDGAEPRASSP